MRERFLFVFVGLLAGLFAGFLLAGSIPQRPAPPPASGLTMPVAVSSTLAEARSHPDNFEAEMKAAELYYQIQRFDDARSYLMKANELRPDNFEVLSNLGMVNLDGGHLDEAEEWFKLALAREPRDTTVLSAYCVVLLEQRNATESASAIALLAQIDPANPDLPQLRTRLQNLKSN